MIKIVKRKTTFEGKDLDFSYSEDFRVLGTEKKVIDLISDFAELNEDTTYQVYLAGELKGTTTNEDFRKENVNISFSALMKKIEKVIINEELVKPLKQNENDNALIIVKNRVVELYC